MFAIGILSLFGMGVAMSMTGSDGVEDEPENTSAEQDDQQLNDSFDGTQDNVFIDFAPGLDLDPDTEDQINDFIADVEENPDRPIEDVVDELHDFLDGLGIGGTEGDLGAGIENIFDSADFADLGDIEDLIDLADLDGFDDFPRLDELTELFGFGENFQILDLDPADAAEDVETGHATPPMGDEFRDPIIIADELEEIRVAEELAAEEQRIADELAAEEQRIADEAAAEEARQPENLVTVTDDTGADSGDAGLAADLEGGPEAYNVTAPDGANEIEVGYDAERTFDITYNADTGTITIGLNSDLQGPEGAQTSNETVEEDDDGVVVTTKVWTKEFEGSADITVNVDQDQIGTHISQIDLTNPNDALHFEFGEEVTGNLHLVFNEVEEGVQGATYSTKSAYIIQTPEDITELTDSQIAALLEDEDGQADGRTILAEVFLGAESVFVNGGQDDGTSEIRILDYVNGEPAITASTGWSSVADFDAVAAQEAGPEFVGVDTGVDFGLDPTVEGGDGGTTGGGGDDDYDPDQDLEGLLESIGINPDFFGGFGLEL